MEKTEFLNQLQKYTVRICDVEEKLKGSGTLLILSAGRTACIMTAAHVVFPFIKEKEKRKQTIKLTCNGVNGKYHHIDIDDVQNVIIHSGYKDKDGNYLNDIAIIKIPWDSWMNDINGVILQEGDAGTEIIGYGFPESLDADEKAEVKKKSDEFAGIGLLEGNIESKSYGRIAISYKADTESDVSRDAVMTGYSGTGLFSLEKSGIYCRGLISCSRGDKAAGYKSWATGIDKLLELANENTIEIGVPESFQMYSDLVANEYDNFRCDSIRNWKDTTYKIIDTWKICPNDFEAEIDSNLICEGNRRFCNEFWKGKLKELVILCQVLEKEKEQLLQPRVQIFDKVTLEYICTEDRAEYILGNLIKDEQFTREGKYHDNMIMLINCKKGHGNDNTFYSRDDCRNILKNITRESRDSTEQFRKLTENLTNEERPVASFDIIKGQLESCNIAAMGIGKLKEVLDKETPESMKCKWNMIIKDLWEEN